VRCQGEILVVSCYELGRQPVAAAAAMAALGAVIMTGGPLGVLGWTGLAVAGICYVLLYPLSDERRFI
jgi:hypothetical protein